MELFAITCTTCKTRLKVRDPAAIGQILACPKCGGMVMVKPPPAFSEVGEQRSDLPTATEVEGPALAFGRTPNSSAFDGLEELLSDAPPRVKPPPSSVTPPPVAPAAPKPRFVGGPPVHRSSTPPVAKVNAVPPVPVNALPVQSAGAATTAQALNASADTLPRRRSRSSGEIPAPPMDAAAPPAAAGAAASRPRANHWLLMAASIVLGSGLALIGVCAVILLRPASHHEAHAPVPKKAASSPVVKQQPASQATTPAIASSSPAPASEAIPTKTPTTVESTATGPVAPAINTPTAADPLGLTTNAAAPAAAAALPANDSLARFDKVIGGPGDDPLAQPATAAPASPPPPAPDTTPARPLAPRPAPRDIDVAKRLEDPLLGIEVPGRPLAEFVQFMSDLSTIPITLEVPFPPASSESRIDLKVSNTTVGKALSAALAGLRLEYVVSDNQLIIRRPEPSPFAPLTIEVKDLTGPGEQEMSDLAEMLQAVVEPGSWGDAEGQGNTSLDAAKGALIVRHRRAVQFQVLIAAEKLRAARSPPLPYKTKLDPSLFKLDSRLKQAGPQLAKPISLNYGQPTRLVEILDRLGQSAGVRILVDWRDVAVAGWNPAGEATLVVSNQPLADALEALLAPLDLTARIIDAQTLQVLTPARLAEQGELEFYKVADLITTETSGEALVAKIRTALGDDSFVAGGGNGEIRFDDDTKCLLAWLPQPKQWQVEAVLTKWRDKSK